MADYEVQLNRHGFTMMPVPVHFNDATEDEICRIEGVAHAMAVGSTLVVVVNPDLKVPEITKICDQVQSIINRKPGEADALDVDEFIGDIKQELDEFTHEVGKVIGGVVEGALSLLNTVLKPDSDRHEPRTSRKTWEDPDAGPFDIFNPFRW